MEGPDPFGGRVGCRDRRVGRRRGLRRGGVTSIYSDSPLRRRFRNIHALTQYFLVKPDTLTIAGAVLAGAEVDLTVF
jgi:hypothetical protein